MKQKTAGAVSGMGRSQKRLDPTRSREAAVQVAGLWEQVQVQG